MNKYALYTDCFYYAGDKDQWVEGLDKRAHLFDTEKAAENEAKKLGIKLSPSEFGVATVDVSNPKKPVHIEGSVVYALITASFAADDEVMLTYNALVSKLPKLEKLFKKHNLEWEEEECIESDGDGQCTEWAGTLIGTYKDAMAFLKGAHPGEELKKLNSYITKI